ncbi:MAG: class I tRNA ligase family protein, partial [Lachnospiraceae bacterium]|nr:class I tRNA ligase family protein [Lachnospiraceae bacterium]
RFINRVWNFFTDEANLTDTDNEALKKLYHQTVKKVTNDFEALGFNTAISQMMIFVNEVYKVGSCPREYAEGLVKLLSPITPHVCEEIWQIMGHDNTIAYESWPKYDEAATVEDTIEIAVQVNGKVRATLQVGKSEEQDTVKEKVFALDEVKKFTDGKQIVKEIYVKGRIYNIVVKG